MDTPLITVSLGVYNRENTVDRAIKSVLAQTYPNFELVIIDNGSTDRSGQIAEEYAAMDGRIRVVHLHPNQGITMRFNMGIVTAKGEFLTYLDDDDYLEPDFIDFMYNLIRENDADISICACPDRGGTGEKLVMTGDEAVIEMMKRKHFNTRPSAKLYRSSLMENVWYNSKAEVAGLCDAATTYKLLANAGRVAFHGIVKYGYTRNDQNASIWVRDHSKLTPEILDTEAIIHRERTEWLSKRFPERAEQFLYYELSFDISMVEKINRYKLTDCQPQLNILVDKLKDYQDIFMRSKWLKDFEKEWMEQYVL